MVAMVRVAAGSLVVGLVSLVAPAAHAANECRVVDVELTPSDKLQMVVWLEDAAGNYVDTLYITRSIGTYGLGNRPGMMEFNSGPAWPYGRRETVFPVWAHRHGLTFPRLEFQNGEDWNLSHPFDESSKEVYFCRPLEPSEPSWDAETCASNVYTDKGVSSNADSLYPPREDLIFDDSRDDPSADLFAQLNPFDAVSQATPMGGAPLKITWPIGPALAAGAYVLYAEVAKEFDMNATYNETSYPSPDVPWSSFGAPYRGQPSVVYAAPIEFGDGTHTAQTEAFAGYGDPDGQDGDLRTPDGSIDVDVPGSGAARLQLVADDAGMYRLRVTARAELDAALPGAASELAAADVDATSAQLSFVAPGDDGDVGTVASYDIRYRAGEPITEANFEDSTIVADTVAPDEPGQVQQLELAGLLPETTYYVGIRAFDDCRNPGPIATLRIDTAARVSGEVDACFVATAAYGSLLANDVEMLRHFRDAFLQQTVLGELAVEAYYTFGPAAAGVIAESELLRATARDALAPVVEQVRGLATPAPVTN